MAVSTPDPLLPEQTAVHQALWDFQLPRDLIKVVNGYQEVQCVLGEHTKSVISLSINSNQQLVASGSDDHTARVWCVDSSEEPKVFKGHTSGVWFVAFHPILPHLLATAGGTGGSVRLWDVETKGQMAVLRDDVTSVARCLAWSPLRESVVAVGTYNGDVRLWDTTTCQMLQSVPPACIQGDGFLSIAYACQKQIMAAGSYRGQLSLWDTRDEYRESGDCKLPVHNAAIYTIHAKPNEDHYLVSASLDQTVRLWDLRKNAVVSTFRHQHEAYSAAFHPKESRVVSTSNDCVMCVWDMHTGETIREVNIGGLSKAVQFFSEGELVVVAPDLKVTLRTLP